MHKLSQKVNRWCIFATLIGGAILIAGKKLKKYQKNLHYTQEKMRLFFNRSRSYFERPLPGFTQAAAQQAPFLLQFHNFGI
jgi:hypothetical protein